MLCIKRFLVYTVSVYFLQDDNFSFNRAALLNIGVLESLNKDEFNCFIFHDVDLLPENNQNTYTCTDFPRHMTIAISTIDYRYELLYISMVITYVYAKNSAPRADRGFLNDIQNTNSNCDITMWAGI